MKKAILVSCFDWYETRLKPIREYLIDKNYSVSILTSDYSHIKKRPIEKCYKECTYISVPRYRKNLSLKRIKSHLYFGNCIKRIINEEKPQLVYVLLPLNNLGRVFSKYKKANPKVKLIVDIIDLWPESMPINRFRRLPIMRIWSSWRNECISVADHVFTECGLYKKTLSGIINEEKTSVLHLYKDEDEKTSHIIDDILQQEKKDNVIRFAYVGSMNSILDIDGICSVLDKTIKEGYNVELHAIGVGDHKRVFKERTEATGCKCVFYGAIFDEAKKANILCKCDYAFNMMKDTSAVGLTIKSIDYFSLGLPIINNIKGDTWKLVDEYNLGINVAEEYSNNIVKKIDHKHIRNVYMNLFTSTEFIKKIDQGLSGII